MKKISNTPSKGILSSGYVVTCSLCERKVMLWHPSGKDIIQTDAMKSLTDKKWMISTHLDGWTCPECIRSDGSESDKKWIAILDNI